MQPPKDWKPDENWTPITVDNKPTLKVGDTVRYHNGFGWSEANLTPFHLSRGFIPTGVHSEIIHLVNPMLDFLNEFFPNSHFQVYLKK